MADSQVLGLFTSPEQYQANQMAQVRQQAANEVQLNPFQQAAIGMRQAGYQLGGGIGGAMGGQDPQLQKIAKRQALLSQLDQSNPQSYMQVAKLASENGDPEFATIIADAGREAAIKVAQANKERQLAVPADIQKIQMIPQIQDAIAKYKAMPQTPETTQQISNLETMLSAIVPRPTKETPANIKEIGVAEGTRAPVYLDVNNDLQFTYQKGAEGKQVRVPYIGGVDRTTAKVSASASSAGETAFTKQLGELDAKKVATAIDTRDNAIGALNSLNRLNELNQQELISGTFASGRVGATNLISTLGLASGKDIDRLSASENYQKTAGDVILATLGGKLGAGFSNEDRKFIQSLVPQLENSPQARKQLVEFMVKKNNSIVEETTRLETYARDNKSLKGYVPKIPIVNLSGGVNKPVSQMTKQELLDEQARLLGKKKP
jgi:hypothetical protein